MRLIDAYENRESFKKTVCSVLKNDFLTSKDKFNQIMTAFDSMPTAYDVDKVVEELETDSSVKLYGSGNSGNYLIPVNRAVEIARKGGATND